MSEVKRYLSTRALPDSGNWNASCAPHTYVRASDYDALQSRLDAAEARARKAETDSHRILKTYKGFERVAGVVSDNSDQVCGENNLLRQQLAERDAVLRETADSLRCSKVFPALLESIDALLSSAEPAVPRADRYACIGKGGEYELIGRADCAGTLRHTGRFTDEVMVYRDTESNALYCRAPGDFLARMEKLPAKGGDGEIDDD